MGLVGKTKTKLTLKLILSIKSFVPVVDKKVGLFKLSLLPVVENYEHDYPVLLLFYRSKIDYHRKRAKRSLEEDYEEETNRVWDENGKVGSKKMRRIRNACRKRPLYVDFSEISYDSWIVQPSGYEVSVFFCGFAGWFW